MHHFRWFVFNYSNFAGSELNSKAALILIVQFHCLLRLAVLFVVEFFVPCIVTRLSRNAWLSNTELTRNEEKKCRLQFLQFSIKYFLWSEIVVKFDRHLCSTAEMLVKFNNNLRSNICVNDLALFGRFQPRMPVYAVTQKLGPLHSREHKDLPSGSEKTSLMSLLRDSVMKACLGTDTCYFVKYT